ncbi:MAG: ABC transporter ATP-binding protein [Clostridium chrysemydis]|uniref:ABC transporter ATP-binding protein n=1 Tax=Clostridium chrysemydis TaxID=2665504 RepID=UPI003F2DC63F
MNVIELEGVSKVYKTKYVTKVALDNIDLKIKKGEFLGIIGASGSGKTTLLNILGCMDILSSGKYSLYGKDVSGLNKDELSDIRNSKVSFVFQHFALIPSYSIYDNIELPLSFRKISKKKKKEKIFNLLKALKIEDQAKKYPKELSGGQKQRVAIARALVSDSDIVLADEPTGALDEKTSKEFMDLLKNINKEGKTIILITHDNKLTKYCDRVIEISDGKIIN